MPVSTKAVGKEFPPFSYEIGREKIREYATAVGETNPLFFDREAAQAAGLRDVMAPPMFVVVYSWEAMGAAIFDPEIEINFAMLVHGAQAFEWGEPVCSGDVISTKVKASEIFQKGDKGFYTFESTSTNQDGEVVCKGTWTNIVRGMSE